MKTKIIFFLFLSLSISFNGYAKILNVFSTESLLHSSKLNQQEKFWLNQAGPLNRFNGVLSNRGPLGYFGPFGKNWWNVTPHFQALENWEDLAWQLEEMGGPLSEMGPLLITTAWGQNLSHFDFTPNSGKLLAAGGVLHALGPSGAFSPLGIGGVLGPHGAHGYTSNNHGQYLNKNKKLVRNIRLKTVEGIKTFELFEYYRGSYARKMKNNDTSFMIEGSLTSSASPHEYSFKSNKNQWVNIVLINLLDLDHFELSLYDEKNKLIISSASASLINFISVKVSAKTKLKAMVNLTASGHFFSKPYRLIVTGSQDNYSVEPRY